MSKDFHAIAQQSLASQDKWELEQLLIEVDKIHPKSILEIGVHLGHGMRHLKEAFEPDFMLGLEQDTCYPYPDINVMVGVNSHDPNVIWDVYAKSKNHPFDFIFIDGDHSRDGVLMDFLCYSAMTKKAEEGLISSIIGFHDIRIKDNPSCEVWKFWQEMKEQNEFNYKEILNPTGQGTGVGLIYL